MIASFGDKATEDLFHSRESNRILRFPNEIVYSALKKLDILNTAASLQDLRSQPGNHLEALKGELKKYHSIRINIRWRLLFRWQGKNAYEVRIVDYH
jgi:toxin HigB-1